MNELRQYVREVIIESRFKQMNKAKFTDLKAALEASSFLDADPSSDLETSDAAKALMDDINDYFNSKFGSEELTLVIKVGDSESDDIAKDDVLKGAAYEFKGGSHFIEATMVSLEPRAEIVGDDSSPMIHPVFRDIEGATHKIYEVIMHELVHMQQFLKFSRGNPTAEKWDQFMAEYIKRGGSAGMGPDYFFFDEEDSPSELETFAYQMATELVNALGKDPATALLRQQNPDFDAIRKNSASFRDIERKSPDLQRPELTTMVRRAKQYAKRMRG